MFLFVLMATPSQMTQTPSTTSKQEEEGQSHVSKELLSSLPREDRWRCVPFYQYQGFWYTDKQFLGLLGCQQHFQPRNSDLVLATMPKSGTTWLKALSFATVNRTRYVGDQHPLLTKNSHNLVPNLEFDLYSYNNNKIPNLDSFTSPALFSTHLPYEVLPKSIKDSKCKVVHLCRNPRDTFVSLWWFLNEFMVDNQEPISLEEAFELFCAGNSWSGPFWDHVLGYWKESLKRPEKILFLKYEELHREPRVQLQRLAEFLGCPFTPKEDKEGVVEDILKLCSFENLSNLEVNKTGKADFRGTNAIYFRRGKVGDWSNYLTPEMIQSLDNIMEQKLQGSGLVFDVYPSPATEV